MTIEPLSPENDEVPGLTVAELRALLDGSPGHLKVTIRTDDFCGGILTAAIETDEEGEDHFAVDCSDDLDDFEEEE
jgi:hypothetical protein